MEADQGNAEDVVENPELYKEAENLGFRLTARISELLPSVSERYYSPWFVTDCNESTNEDHCVLFHSNSLAVITIAPTHDIIRGDKIVTKVDFQINDSFSRLKNKVSGKHKRGAHPLKKTSVLCFVECSDGSRYQILSCVPGKLLEVNETLVKQPELLTQETWSCGYIAIILQQKNQEKQNKAKMLSVTDYVNSRRSDIPERFFIDSPKAAFKTKSCIY